jgi:hypothetical protein
MTKKLLSQSIIFAKTLDDHSGGTPFWKDIRSIESAGQEL